MLPSGETEVESAELGDGEKRPQGAPEVAHGASRPCRVKHRTAACSCGGGGGLPSSVVKCSANTHDILREQGEGATGQSVFSIREATLNPLN